MQIPQINRPLSASSLSTATTTTTTSTATMAIAASTSTAAAQASSTQVLAAQAVPAPSSTTEDREKIWVDRLHANHARLQARFEPHFETHAKSPSHSSAEKLPKEMLQKIFINLKTPHDLTHCALVNRTWRDTAYDDRLWRPFLNTQTVQRIDNKEAPRDAQGNLRGARDLFQNAAETRRPEWLVIDARGDARAKALEDFAQQIRQDLETSMQQNQFMQMLRCYGVKTLPDSLLRLLQDGRLKEEQVRRWARAVVDPNVNQQRREVYVAMFDGRITELVAASLLPVDTLLEWFGEVDKEKRSAQTPAPIPWSTLARALRDPSTFRSLTQGLPAQQLDAWLRDPLIFERVLAYTSQYGYQELIDAWKIAPQRLNELLTLKKEIPPDVLDSILPYIDTLELDVNRQTVLKYCQRIRPADNPGVRLQRNDDAFALYTRADLAPILEQAAAVYDQLVAPKKEVSTETQSIQAQALRNFERQLAREFLSEQRTHISRLELLRGISPEPTFRGSDRSHLASSFDPDGPLAQALQQRLFTLDRLRTLCLRADNNDAVPLCHTITDVDFLLSYIVPAVAAKKHDFEALIHWWQTALHNDELRLGSIAGLIGTGTDLSALNALMDDQEITTAVLKAAFSDGNIKRHFFSTCVVQLKELQPFLRKLSREETNFYGALEESAALLLGHPLAAVLEGNLPLALFKNWCLHRENRPSDLLNHIETLIDDRAYWLIDDQDRRQNIIALRRQLFGALDFYLSTKGLGHEKCIHHLDKIVDTWRHAHGMQVPVAARHVAFRTASQIAASSQQSRSTPPYLSAMRTALNTIPGPWRHSYPQLKRALEDARKEVDAWLAHPQNRPFRSELEAYRKQLIKLQHRAPDAQALQALEATADNVVSLRDTVVQLHTQLEQQMQGRAEDDLPPRLHRAIVDIATPGAWAGDNGDIAPNLITRIANWPAHRALIIQDAHGREISRSGRETLVSDGAPSIPEHDAVIVRRSHGGDHYDLIMKSKDGEDRRIFIDRDGDCFYNAILAGFLPKERVALLGGNPYGLPPALALRHQMALTIITDPTVRRLAHRVVDPAAFNAEAIRAEETRTTPPLSPIMQKSAPSSAECAPFNMHTRRYDEDHDDDAGGLADPSSPSSRSGRSGSRSSALGSSAIASTATDGDTSSGNIPSASTSSDTASSTHTPSGAGSASAPLSKQAQRLMLQKNAAFTMATPRVHTQAPSRYDVPTLQTRNARSTQASLSAPPSSLARKPAWLSSSSFQGQISARARQAVNLHVAAQVQTLALADRPRTDRSTQALYRPLPTLPNRALERFLERATPAAALGTAHTMPPSALHATATSAAATRAPSSAAVTQTNKPAPTWK